MNAMNLIPSGYKQTEVGVIPEDWNVAELGDIGECLIGLTYKPSNVKADGTLVLRSSNVQDGSLSFDDNVYVDAAIPSRIRVLDGDILVCVRNGSRSLIGKCALLDNRVVGQTFGAFMSVYRTDDFTYVFQQFQSALIKRQITENIGATINQITNRNLNSFKIPFPTNTKERETIATTLSDVDALLAAQDKLVAKKRDIKQAAMQQLLTGKQRLPGFSGEWEVKRLGELGTFSKGSGVRKDESLSGDLPCVRYGEIYTQHNDYIKEFNSSISAEVAATAKLLKKGDLLFAGSGETKEEIGKCVAFVDALEAYAGGDIVILRPDNADSIFLGYYLNTKPITLQKASRGQGDAVVHISANALFQIIVTIPKVAEQTAIAAVLSDMDADLTALEQQRDKTRSLKQGMMQELLTGRIRLV
jgi:type I restriction enzyme, S subunit